MTAEAQSDQMAMKTDGLQNFLALKPPRPGPVRGGLCSSALGSSSALPRGSDGFWNWEFSLERGRDRACRAVPDDFSTLYVYIYLPFCNLSN